MLIKHWGYKLYLQTLDGSNEISFATANIISLNSSNETMI